jgi:predicted enzyme related to lactoylglutathione lyase
MPQIAGFPVLSFQVADLFSTIEKLDELGATMEGGVRQLAFGMVAAMRSPEGHLLSLLQPANDEQLREIIQSDAGSE